MAECLLFLQRPAIKPSYRIYCLGFLNKFAESCSLVETRASLLHLYFGLFNKLLHNQPEVVVAEADKNEDKNKKPKKSKKIHRNAKN